MSGLPYRPDVDGLRGIAVLLVVLFHVGIEKVFLHFGLRWGGGGFVGVDVFFVLSGYLIIGQLIREHELTGGVQIRAFYARRIRRLLPLATLTLLLTQGVAILALPTVEWSRIARDAVAAAIFFANFHFALEARTYSAFDVNESPVLHFWSLSVEEQAYLVFPGLVALALRFGQPSGAREPAAARLRACAWLLVVLIVSLMLSEAGARSGDPWAYYSMHTRLFEVALGGAVASAEPFLSRARAERVAGALGLAGVLAISGCALLYSRATPFPGLAALIPSVSTAMLVVAGHGAPRSLTVRALGAQPLRFLGQISYAWYLVHWPFLVFAGPLTFRERAPGSVLAVAAVLSLAFAAFLHRVVEQPTRTSRRLLKGWTPLALLVASIGTTSMVAAAMYSGAQRRGELGMTPLEARLDNPRLLPAGCDQDFFDLEDAPCTFGDRAAPVPDVVLVGDSHAAQLLPAFDAVLRATGRSGWLFTKATCPPVDVRRLLPAYGREYWECTVWREAVIEKINMLRPHVVVLARMGVYGTSIVDRAGVRAEGEAGLREWANGARRQFERLRPLAGRLLLVRDTPRLPYDAPRCLGGTEPETCTITMSSVYWDAGLFAGESLAMGGLDMGLLDLNPDICPDGTACPLVESGVIKLRDSNHLTATYAALLGPALSRELAEQGALFP